MDAAPALTTPILSYAPDLARRVGFIVVKLCLLIVRDARKPHFIRTWLPLCRRLCRILHRFTDLMGCLAGQPPHLRRGPHTGGAPRPLNLLLARRLSIHNGDLLADLGWEAADCGWHLEQILAEPRAAEILARVPAAARILWPLRNMLGLGPFDRSARRYRPPNPRPLWTHPRPSAPRGKLPKRNETGPILPAPGIVRRRKPAPWPSVEPDPPRRDFIRFWADPPPEKPP
jgi:hypothetical protein